MQWGGYSAWKIEVGQNAYDARRTKSGEQTRTQEFTGDQTESALIEGTMTPAIRRQHRGQERLGGAAKATETSAMSWTIEDISADPKQRANTRTEMQHGYGPERGRLDPPQVGRHGQHISLAACETKTGTASTAQASTPNSEHVPNDLGGNKC